MSKHTPGPWCVTKDGLTVKREGHPDLVARTCGRVGLPPRLQRDRRQTNARLIAAAPVPL